MASKPGAGMARALFLIVAAIAVAARLTHSAGPERPLFQVDTAWPKIPNGWALGQVSSARRQREQSSGCSIAPA